VSLDEELDAALAEVAMRQATILLPPKVTKRWPSIAGDVYTDYIPYWAANREFVGNSPSTLGLVLQEIFLPQRNKIIPQIHATMKRYLAEGILVERGTGFVMVERTLQNGKVRRGLMAALDLEMYRRGVSDSLIRATEGTIQEKLEARWEIRKKAELELPHTMELYRDPKSTIMAILEKAPKELLYNTQLPMDGGSIKGWLINDRNTVLKIAETMVNLKYGLPGKAPILFADGDGNHSMATARIDWEERRAQLLKANLPLEHSRRYTLVELINIYDPGLEFMPIHRVLYGTNIDEVSRKMKADFGNDGVSIDFCDSAYEAEKMQSKLSELSHSVRFISSGQNGVISMKPRHPVAVGTLQTFIDKSGMVIKYVHGEEEVDRLCSEPSTVGLKLLPVKKDDFFDMILLTGVLPEKAFSLGQAYDKRYYVECRRLS